MNFPRACPISTTFTGDADSLCGFMARFMAHDTFSPDTQKKSSAAQPEREVYI